jgi:protein tyrosine phosphatase (PTP) superfamily phosphohydrolase (DUF442 family)
MKFWLAFLTVAVPALAHADDDSIGLLELVNYHEYSSRLASAGQPTREQFAAIRAAGIEAIINLAPVTDPTALADEGDIVATHGIAYVHIPVDWDNPTAADVTRFFAAMREFAARRTLVHCYAGSRASAFVYLYRVLEQDAPRADSYATLLDIWDNNPGYELPNVPQWLALLEQVEREPAAVRNP